MRIAFRTFADLGVDQQRFPQLSQQLGSQEEGQPAWPFALLQGTIMVGLTDFLKAVLGVSERLRSNIRKDVEAKFGSKQGQQAPGMGADAAAPAAMHTR